MIKNMEDTEEQRQMVLSIVDDAINEPNSSGTNPAAVEEVKEDTTTEKPAVENKSEDLENQLEMKQVEFELIDPDTWRIGRVHDWKHTWGFMEQIGGDSPEDGQPLKKIFVHAANVKCKDRFTFLRKGMQLKYQEAVRAGDDTRRCAVNVCNLKGEEVSYFDHHGDTDNFSRREVTPGVKYTGVVKNYFFRRRFGWIQPDNEDEERRFLNKDIYVAREDILSKEFPPGLRAGTLVEFELYEDDRGIGACKVTGLDGALIETNTIRKDFEDMTFTGTVEKFRLHGYLFIKPDQNLREFGVWGSDVHADCESINTDQRPARLVEKSKVTFKLMKDKNGFHAIDINDENGEPIKIPEEEINDPFPSEREMFEDTFTGKVRSFSWSKGSGWIEPEDLSAELQAKATHREGLIYFYRRDLVSEDKVFGIHENSEVKFQCYVDEKGIGACNITDKEGQALKDMKRPMEQDQVQQGTVNYYDRQKRVLHVRYKGRVHAVPKKHILILREAEHLLRRGTRVEFLVDRWRGKNYLKQVSFPGRRAKPKESEYQEPQHHGNNGYHNYHHQNNHHQPLFNPYQAHGYMSPFQSNPFFTDFFNERGQGPPPHSQGFTQYPGTLPPAYGQAYHHQRNHSYV